MKFEGKFKNEKGEIVDWWFQAPDENALKKHLDEKNWEIIQLKKSLPGVSAIGILSLGLGPLSLPILKMSGPTDAELLLSVIFALGFFISGIGIIRFKCWARNLFLTLMGLFPFYCHCYLSEYWGSIIYTLLPIFFLVLSLIYFSRRKVREIFRTEDTLIEKIKCRLPAVSLLGLFILFYPMMFPDKSLTDAYYYDFSAYVKLANYYHNKHEKYPVSLNELSRACSEVNRAYLCNSDYRNGYLFEIKDAGDKDIFFVTATPKRKERRYPLYGEYYPSACVVHKRGSSRSLDVKWDETGAPIDTYQECEKLKPSRKPSSPLY